MQWIKSMEDKLKNREIRIALIKDEKYFNGSDIIKWLYELECNIKDKDLNMGLTIATIKDILSEWIEE
jgi:hypothetical protein